MSVMCLIICIIVCIISMICICGGGIAKYNLEKARSEMFKLLLESLWDDGVTGE